MRKSMRLFRATSVPQNLTKTAPEPLVPPAPFVQGQGLRGHAHRSRAAHAKVLAARHYGLDPP